MPKQTFFNLKDEKRQRIIDAAEREFSQCPLYESSINNIIKDAKIPRGSFYQYFDDLSDLYGYYFSLILEDIQENLIDSVQEADGDIFSAVKKYAGEYMKEIISGNHRDFYRNFFLGANISKRSKDGKHPGFDVYHSNRMKELRANLKKEVNWKLLKVTNEKDQNMIQQLIMMIFFHSFANYFVHSNNTDSDPAEVQKEIERNLNWLEFGARRTEDK